MNPILYHGTSTRFENFRINRPSMQNDEAVYLAFSPYKAISHTSHNGYIAQVEVAVPPEKWVNMYLRSSEYPEWLSRSLPFSSLSFNCFEEWYNDSCIKDPNLLRSILCHSGIYAIQSFDDVSPTSNRHELRVLSTDVIKITKWYQHDSGKNEFLDPDTGEILMPREEIMRLDKENTPNKYICAANPA